MIRRLDEMTEDGYDCSVSAHPNNRVGLFEDDSDVSARLLPPQSKSKASLRLWGGLCILIAVISWIAMAENLQALQQGLHVVSKPFNKPYFQTYLIHSGYALSMMVWAIWYFGYTVRRNPEKLKQQITPKLIGITLIFSFISFCSGMTWYISLPITSVSSNTAIYQSSCVFIFLFSIFMLKEKVSLLKIFSVLICVVGVVAVSFYGSGGKENGNVITVMGYIWVLVSTILYSFAETVYGLLVKNHGGSDTSFSFLFLGLVGLNTFIFYWPGVWILHVTQLETFEFPTGPAAYSLLITVVLDAVFNSSFFVGINLTSPLFMAVGSLLTLPLSMLVDKFLNNYVLPAPALVGMAAIVLGFIGLNMTEVLAENFEAESASRSDSKLRRFGRFIVKDLKKYLCRKREKDIMNHIQN